MKRRTLLQSALLAHAPMARAAVQLKARDLGGPPPIARISLPADWTPSYDPSREDERLHRLAFQFAVPDFWGSMGGVTRYRQLAVVTLLAADAPQAAATAQPRGFAVSYEQRAAPRRVALAGGELTVTDAVYAMGVDRVAAVEYLYQDRDRRLQILWHAVRDRHDAATAPQLIERIAASFRLLRDPAPVFAEARAVPVREAAQRGQNRATLDATLQREGYGQPVPGRPIWRRGAYLEVMVDPEPRYQLLSPLGRMRAPPGGAVVNRPRPLGDARADIGWREWFDGDWRFMNLEHAYLPLPGIAARLAAHQQDPDWVYFYLAHSVRIDEEPGPERLQTLQPYFGRLAQVQALWREGRLAGPGRPEDDPWPR